MADTKKIKAVKESKKGKKLTAKKELAKAQTLMSAISLRRI
jgi:hypothetical protein